MKFHPKALRISMVDRRDFSHDRKFGTIPANLLPYKEFDIGPAISIKNQYDTDLCTACAVTSASEYQEEVELSPEYQFKATKKLMGDFKPFGADIRTAILSAIKAGSLEAKDSPYRMGDTSRDTIANWNNWPAELDKKAMQHSKKALFTVDGPNDLFTNIWAMIWQHREFKRAVITGALWRPEWSKYGDGTIPATYAKTGTPHAFIFKGTKLVKGEMRLKAQLSNGTDFGDQGYFYFPRQVVNKEFYFGNFMLIDCTPEEIAELKTTRTLMEQLIDLMQTYINLLKVKLA